MSIQFLRGDPQAPKGHAIFIARSTTDTHTVLATYCVVPPMPLSLAKYLPSFLASQLPPEDLQDATNVPVMPIPPMLEEGSTLERLQMLAERRDDDVCDIGTINPKDEGARMQLVAQGCQEYGQLYVSFASGFAKAPAISTFEAEELLIQTMTERQRLAELGKLVGNARYALEGHDARLVEDTKRRMQRIAKPLAD